jgi:hypothetical protein
VIERFCALLTLFGCALLVFKSGSSPVFTTSSWGGSKPEPVDNADLLGCPQ